MSIEAPFQTANDLTSQPGNAALGGVAQNFDPENKNPGAPLQQAFQQYESENNDALQKYKQQVFQKQQAQQAFQNDLLAKSIDYENKMRAAEWQRKGTMNLQLLQNLNDTKQSLFNVTDPQTGGNRSYEQLPDDKVSLENNADKLRRELMDNPDSITSSQVANDLQDHLKQVNIAGMRSKEVSELRAQQATEFRPEEKQNIQQSIDYIMAHPGEMPRPHESAMKGGYLLPDVDYTKKEGLESVDGAGNDKNSYLARPQTYYDGMLVEDDPQKLYAASNNVQNAIKGGFPEFRDPASFADFNNRVQNIWLRKHDTPLNFGSVDGEGKINLNPDYRIVNTAMQIAHDGGGKLDPDAEKDALDLQGKRLSNQKTQADIDKLHQEQTNGGKQKPTTPEEKAIYQSSENTVAQAKQYFEPTQYEKSKVGIPITPVKIVTNTHWFKPDETKDDYQPIAGVNVGAALAGEGMTPTDWKIYPAPAGIEAGVGKQRVGVGVDQNGQANGKEFKTGENKKVDRSFMAYNPTTKEVRALYFGKNKDGDYQLINSVTGRDYVTHAPNEKYQWGVKGGKQASQLEEETTQNQNLWDGVQSNPAATPAISKYPDYDERTTSKGGKYWVKDNKPYKEVNGKLVLVGS